METMQAVELVARFEKETKNTVRFAEVTEPGEPTVVGTVYVQKYAWERLGQPESVTVTVAAS